MSGGDVTGAGLQSRRATSARRPIAAVVSVVLLGALLGFAPPATDHAGAGAGAGGCTEAPFVDVPVGHPFCQQIAWLKAEGITQGFGDGSFRPGARLPRQGAAAWLFALAGPAGGLAGCTEAPFVDVPVGHPFCEQIAWLKAEGITQGFGDGSFRPGATLPRQGAAAWLFALAGPAGGLAGCTEAPFVDVPVGHPFCEQIAWVADERIAAGFADGSFGPGRFLVRQALASLMWNGADVLAPPDGFVDHSWFAARQDDYLGFATTQRDQGSVLNLLAHLERAERDPGFDYDASGDGPDQFAGSWNKIDGYLDTADFDMLYLVNLWYGYGDELSDELRTRIETAMLDFEYWYTDPTAPGTVDQRWYWSENHRIIFHTLEYLAGQAFPNHTFTVSGMTGLEHAQRAAAQIQEWLDEKADYGFSEWHSDVYYQKDVTPLLSLVEWADDPQLAERASMMLDLVLFDLATHTRDGNNGATHGRSYMKDKSRAPNQDVFGIVKLLFDDTSEPYASRGDAGASLLARARRYQLPEVVRLAAISDEPMVDRERMGVPSGIEGPLVADPPAPYGFDFDDPDNVPFWWERGALTAWPVVPLTLQTIEDYNLWESPAFAQFKDIADIVGDDYDLAKLIAYQLRDMINIGLLDEVNTYTYRTGDVMLSSAQDYRFGARGDQYHAWQATLGARASVFTTHPATEPRPGDRWVDGDLYWSGTGSMPRSAQQGGAGIHLYSPAFENPDPGLLEPFQYLDYTHAWFPTEEFDEVVQSGNWTFGREEGGYVALWSWRPTEWRLHDPTEVFTNGLTEPFDLVAPGGPDNVWLVEVADAADWGDDFGAFRAAMEASAPAVVEIDPEPATGPYGGFSVSWASPSQGLLEFGTQSPFVVGGNPVALDGYPRYDNPFTQTAFLSPVVSLAAGERTLTLDFDAWTRTAG